MKHITISYYTTNTCPQPTTRMDTHLLGFFLVVIWEVIFTVGEKRLILSGNTYTSSACQQLFYCNIVCVNGYKTGQDGCPQCQCSGPPYNSVSVFSPHYFNGNTYSHPCLPHQQFCPLQCNYGFVTGTGGCQYCICKSPVTPQPTTTTTTPITTTQTVKVQMSNPCLTGQTVCNKLCKNGYLLGPGNCQYCICAPAGLVYTTAKPTIPSTTTELPHYLSNPCIAGAHVCSAKCQYGYILGPGNCQYCMCSKMTTTTMATTTAAAAKAPGQAKPHLSQSHPNTTTSTSGSIASGHMDNECTIALTICQLKCKNGFMADVNNCKYCVCKDEIYQSAGILKADEPVIHLMNPCVKGLDECNIFCYHGYLRGPRKCQYCACSK